MIRLGDLAVSCGLGCLGRGCENALRDRFVLSRGILNCLDGRLYGLAKVLILPLPLAWFGVVLGTENGDGLVRTGAGLLVVGAPKVVFWVCGDGDADGTITPPLMLLLGLVGPILRLAEGSAGATGDSGASLLGNAGETGVVGTTRLGLRIWL